MLRPKIKEYLDVFPTSNDRYQIRGSEYLSVLRGKTVKDVFRHLLPLLNGEYTIDQLIKKLDGVAPPKSIEALIHKMEELGILEDASSKETQELSPDQAQAYRNQMMFFSIASQQPDGAKYQRILLKSKLAVIGNGQLAARIIAEGAQAGIGVVAGLNFNSELTSPPNSLTCIETPGLALGDVESVERVIANDLPSLLVLALDRPEPGLLDGINQISQNLNIRLLHTRINGTEGIVGPLVVPGTTACLKCHHLRVARNLDFYDEYLQWEQWIEGKGKKERSAIPSIASFICIIAGMATLEITKTLSSFYEPELYGRFFRVNALTLEVIPHRVLRIPRCPSCGKARDKADFTPWLGRR